MKKFNKRNFKENKEKKAYITWEDNELDSSSDSENEIKMCMLDLLENCSLF